MRWMSALASGFALLASAPAVSAAEWHVTPTGSTAGAGTLADPWDLPGVAAGGLTQILPGDTIWVHEGTYGDGGNQPLIFQLYGTKAAPIRVRAAEGERATFLGQVRLEGQ